MAGHPGLIDTRVLGKSDRIYGKENDWDAWRDQFESWAGLLDATVGAHLAAATKVKDPIAYDPLTPEMKIMTKLVFHVLMNLCKMTASVSGRRVQNQQGFEADRRLAVRFDVQTDGRHLADLNILMNPEWNKDGEEFEDDVED